MSTRQTVVLAVDDHPLIRCALREVLYAGRSGAEFLEASNPEEGLSLVSQRPDLDLLFLDLYFSAYDGLAYLERFRRAAPQVPVIVYTMFEDAAKLTQALALGAAGIVPKTHSPQLVRRAIELVLEGGVYLPPQLARQLAVAEPAPGRMTPAPVLTTVSVAPRAPMSDQQWKILELLVEGMPNKLIARRLGLAPSTVKNQLTCVFETLGVSNRTQAAMVARNLRASVPAFEPHLAST
jgi:DNA-binding NarL/FixJ family response regulator